MKKFACLTLVLVLCPEGGHMAFYDDPEPYFKGLLAFLKDIEGKP